MDVRTLVSPFAAAALVCLALVSPTPTVRAQVVEEELVPITSPCSRTSRLTSDMECDDGAVNGSLIIEREITFPMQQESRTLETGQCQAQVKLDYLQYDDYVRVDGSVDTATCAAAGGSFALVVRTGERADARVTQEFQQEWRRDAAEPALFSATLPIPDDTDLVRVRAERIRCSCAGAAAEAAIESD